jgi:hypothetical protein
LAAKPIAPRAIAPTTKDQKLLNMRKLRVFKKSHNSCKHGWATPKSKFRGPWEFQQRKQQWISHKGGRDSYCGGFSRLNLWKALAESEVGANISTKYNGAGSQVSAWGRKS